MNLFGFNISRASAPPVKKSLSAEAAAWLRGENPEDGGAVLSNAYQQVVWVYRAINVLADQVANIPFLFSTGERGRETLITSGPLIDFYNQPHRNLNRFQYWELRIIWLMLRGECFRVPIYEDKVGRGVPTAPFPLSASGGEGRGEVASQRRSLKNVLFLDPAH